MDNNREYVSNVKIYYNVWLIALAILGAAVLYYYKMGNSFDLIFKILMCFCFASFVIILILSYIEGNTAMGCLRQHNEEVWKKLCNFLHDPASDINLRFLPFATSKDNFDNPSVELVKSNIRKFLLFKFIVLSCIFILFFSTIIVGFLIKQ